MATIVDLTLILRGAAPDPAAPPALTGHAKDVDLLIAKKRESDKVAGEFNKVRRTLCLAATDHRNELEEKGTFTTKVVLPGTSETLDMGFTDQLKTIEIPEAEAIENAIGGHAVFKKLFQRERAYSIVGEMSEKRATKLRKILRAAGEDPAEWVKESECFGPKDDFRKTRFELRPGLTATQNAALDLVITTKQYEPRLGGVKWAEVQGNTNGKKK